MKYSWHVKWRRYCPISWLLCWMFEKGWLCTEFLLDLESFFCPEEQEIKEEVEAGEHLDHSGTWTSLDQV